MNSDDPKYVECRYCKRPVYNPAIALQKKYFSKLYFVCRSCKNMRARLEEGELIELV